MVKPHEAWSRVSRLKQFAGADLKDYILQVINLNFTLTTGQASPSTPVQLPAGMILLGVCAAARPQTIAATTVYAPGLDLFQVAIDYQAQNRSVAGTSQGIGSAVFGPYGDQFPAEELVIPVQGALLYSVTNLTTTTILITFAHHGLVPKAIG